MFPSARLATEYRAVLDDPGIDAVVLSTPAQSHYSLAMQALIAGEHVMVEMPLGMSVAEARELEMLATQLEKVLMVGRTVEFSPAVHKMKELVGGADIGDVYYLY